MGSMHWRHVRFGPPKLAAVMRHHYGSFKAFVTCHAGQVRQPKSGETSTSSATPPLSTTPLPATDEAATLAAFHQSLCEWMHARGGRVSAAQLGEFYEAHPEYAMFKGKWRPSKNCEQDARLDWKVDAAAPGGGWIELGELGLARIATAHPGVAVQARETEALLHMNDGFRGEDAIKVLTATGASISGFQLWVASQTIPHPAIAEIVCASGEAGITVPTLKMQLEIGLRLQKTVKTAFLAIYVKSFPGFFNFDVLEDISAGVAGAKIDRVFAIQAGSTDNAWRHAARFLPEHERQQQTEDELLASSWEFLYTHGIDTQTAALMSGADFVQLGLSNEAANAVLANAREIIDAFDGDVYADLDGPLPSRQASINAGQELLARINGNASTGEQAASHREVELQQQVDELLTRCSDLQLRVSVLEEARMCVICMEQRRDTVVMPCMHAMFCGQCLRVPNKATSCPICRGNIAGLVECRLDMLEEDV